MFKYSNKTAVVTGASRGIGKEIATTLADNGMQVIGIATSEKSLDTIRDIKNIIPFCCDISDEKSIEDLYTFVTEHSSNIDILVNNAGIHMDNILLRMQTEEWKKVFLRVANRVRGQRSKEELNIREGGERIYG